MGHQLRHLQKSPKSFAKDIIERLAIVIPRFGRADATGPSRSHNAVCSLFAMLCNGLKMGEYEAC